MLEGFVRDVPSQNLRMDPLRAALKTLIMVWLLTLHCECTLRLFCSNHHPFLYLYSLGRLPQEESHV